MDEGVFQTIFVSFNLDAAFNFAKDLYEMFPEDVLTGFTISAFTGTKNIMMLASFEVLEDDYEQAIQKLIEKYYPNIGVINLLLLDKEKVKKYKNEVLRGDMKFTGCFDFDFAKKLIKNKWDAYNSKLF